MPNAVLDRQRAHDFESAQRLQMEFGRDEVDDLIDPEFLIDHGSLSIFWWRWL
jgi:hypothetical protein